MDLMKWRKALLFVASGITLAAVLPSQAVAQGPAPVGHVSNASIWPSAKSRGLIDRKTERRIDRLIAGMSLEQKVGQMIQADIGSIKPEDLRKYPLGSILVGGSSPPLGAPDRSPAGPWVASARAFSAVAMEDRAGNLKIPLTFGIDAVHGNSNVVGATIFPHNIGLGAARNPELLRRIGAATARETLASGFDWAFGPTLAVARDDRWGRTYESYSEDPAIVRSYAAAMVEGLQGGAVESDSRVQKGRVTASAKHFMGDGGTRDGIDQGDVQLPERDFMTIHAAGYPPAIDAGVRTVMASYNSWQGVKMHGNKSLLTDVLKGRMGFDGFIVGDWNGHGQIPGCTPTDCAAAFNAGLDMAMAPDSWKGLYESTLAHVRSGAIPMSRVDDSVRRILRVKFRAGLFDQNRPFENQPSELGAPAHRALAREAVAQSLVLLKNEGALPIKSSARVLVAGAGADNIGQQSGGWSLSWQGDGNSNADFPNGESIYSGIAKAVTAGGGTATLSVDGNFSQRPDVAIVVFGEQPYAEMRGDIRTLEFEAGDKQSLALLRTLKRAGIPVVSVFLSGRPLWVNPELNQSDAFVAAWLPGTEGTGVADVLIGDHAGKPRRDFTGKLSFSWPKTAGQFTLNQGSDPYDPLFPLGYGLTYAQPGKVPALPEAAGVDASLANTTLYFARGRVPAPFALRLEPSMRKGAVDSADTQEGAMQLAWSGGETAVIEGPALDLNRETNAELSVQMTYRVDKAATGPVQFSFAGGKIDISQPLKGGTGRRILKVPLKCMRANGADMAAVTRPWAISSNGPLTLSISDIRLVTAPENAYCPAG